MKLFRKIYSKLFSSNTNITSTINVKNSNNITQDHQNDFTQPPIFKIILNDDINVAKKQVKWRVRNMGQLELEVLLLKWYDKNESKLSLEDLKEFTKEVLELEIPELNKYLLQHQPLPKNSKYLDELINFHYRL